MKALKHTCTLTSEEREKLLAPIKNHGHCYGFHSKLIIDDAIKTKKLLCEKCWEEKEREKIGLQTILHLQVMMKMEKKG